MNLFVFSPTKEPITYRNQTTSYFNANIMKKFLPAFLGFLLSVFHVVDASADELYLGYCEGEIANGTDKGQITGKIGSGIVEVAIRIPAKELTRLVGNKITKVRAGLPAVSKLPDFLNGWIRLDKAGKNIAVSANTPAVVGWNELVLETPLAIADTADLWIGFSWTQSTKLNIISLAGPTNPDGGWVNKGGLWNNLAKNNYGSLSLEGVVEGGLLPQYDLELLSCNLITAKIRSGKNIQVYGRVKNKALHRTDHLQFDYSIGGKPLGTAIIDHPLNYREETEFSFEIPTTGVEVADNVPLDITLKIADNIADEDPKNNQSSFTITIFDNAYSRRTVIEEFTTEKCPNCPAGVARIESAVNSCSSPNDVIWICHHTGYYTDWLTIPASNNYTWFYAGGGTYAPALMINRTHFNGFSDAGSPVGFPGASSTIREILDKELDETSFVDVTVSARYEEGKAYLQVTGEKYDAFDTFCPTAYLHVLLKEDNIVAKKQEGASNFIHDNVIRTLATPTWGEAVTWNDHKFTAEYEINIDSSWKPENITAVAFISNLSQSNRLENVIHNAASCKLSISDAIVRIENGNVGIRSIEYFSLDGTRSSDKAAVQGICFERITYNNGTVKVRKTLR